MKSRYWLLMLALLPLAVGVAVAFWLERVFQPVPVLIFRADSRSAALIVGGLLAVITLALLYQGVRGGLRRERELAESQAEQERARRRFLRRLDHEIKNPLTAMRAALANLIDTAASPEQEKQARDIRYQVERLGQLAGDLRKLAELEERPLEALPVNLAEMLPEVVEMARSQPAYRERQITLAVPQVPWPLPKVTGDSDLLWLVFYNLVDNALKYTTAEQVVEVRAQEDGRSVSVEVADNGPGIAGEDLERIFEELYRGANARGSEGSGLGLALANRIVQRHGGMITVRSRAAGAGGTVFVVRLPVARRE